MYPVLLILHFIGLAMGVGASFAMLALGLASKGMPQAERAAFLLRASAVSKNGSIGLLLLILSGAGMMAVAGPQAVMAWGGGWFHAKLVGVVVLAGWIGTMQVVLKKAKAAQGGPGLKLLPKLGMIGLVLSLAIVVFAVLAFAPHLADSVHTP